jgi:SSS family solute:Na+ symporter/sodium/proline symporter
MTVSELSRALRDKIPAHMACDWDNDGIMCMPDPDRTVQKALLVLDITDDAVEYAVTGNYDAIIPKMLSGLPAILIDVVVVLVLSASMSTLEALVLTSASAVAVDLIPCVSKKEIAPKSKMLLTRIFCLAFVACSFIFATQNIPIIVSLMSFSWGIVSGCFIGPYLWGLFSKRITKIGAYAGIFSGLLTVGGATLVISLTDGFSAAASKSPEMGVAAMAISAIVVPLVSRLTKNSAEDTERVEALFSSLQK